MKQFKLVLFSIMLLIPLTFTSCLKGSDPLPAQGSAVVTVVNSYLGATTLEDDFGNTLNVSKNSTGFDFTKVKRAVVYYEFMNEDELNGTSKTFTINVTAAAGIDGKVVYTHRGSNMDSLKTRDYNPILNFDKMIRTDTIIGKNGFITAAINYYFSFSKIHDFSLYRYSEDLIKPAVSAPDTIDLYFGHNAKGDKGEYKMSQWGGSYPQLYFKSFYVEQIVPEIYDGSYRKDTLIMRIKYQKDTNVARRDTVDAACLVKYVTKKGN